MSSSLWSSAESEQRALLFLRSTSKLDGQFRNLSNGRSAVSFSMFGFRVRSFVNSLCNLPTSSGVKLSSISSDEVGSSWISWLSAAFSFKSLFPKVPIASNPWGQSLNSSRGSCFAGSTQQIHNYMTNPNWHEWYGSWKAALPLYLLYIWTGHIENSASLFLYFCLSVYITWTCAAFSKCLFVKTVDLLCAPEKWSFYDPYITCTFLLL